MMAAASRFKCYERRTVEVPDCKERDPKDCNRTYHVYLPSIICGTNTNSNDEDEDRTLEENDVGRSAGESTDPPDLETIGTLPLVFGIHCLGCIKIFFRFIHNTSATSHETTTNRKSV